MALFCKANNFNFMYLNVSFFSLMDCLFYVLFRKAFFLLYLKLSAYVLLNYFQLSSVKTGLKLENSFSGCHLTNRWRGIRLEARGPVRRLLILIQMRNRKRVELKARGGAVSGSV